MARKTTTVTIPVTYLTNDKALKKSKSVFGKFARGIGGAAATAVAAVGAIASAAMRMSSELETSFAKIEGLVGVSSAEVAKLEEAAIRLGPAYGKSAQEAADALFFITSAGLRGAEATEVLEASLKASAAGLGDVEPIANAATAAMNTYGSETLSGADAVDALTEAVRLGQLAPAELSGALGKVIPIANELGVSFEETTGLVAGLTRGGLTASEAVTGIRGAMQAVLKPTGESAAMLEQYGFSAQDVKDSIEQDGLLNTFGMLREAFGENEEDFTRLIGSQEGLNAVLAMTGEASEDYTDIVSQMTDEVGALDDAFGAVEDTAGFKFDKAMETAKAALLPVGETLLIIASQFLDNLMPVIELLAPLLEQMFAHLEEPLNQLMELLPGLIEAFLPVLPVIGELAGLVAELAVAAMPAFMALLELLIPLLDPIMVVLTSIVDIFIAFLPALTSIIEALLPLIEMILPIFLDLWLKLEEPILMFIEALVKIIEEILPFLEVWLSQVVIPLLGVLAEVFGVVLVFAIETLAGWLEWLAEKMGGTGESFADTWHNVSVAVINIINKMITGLENFINFFVDGINKMISGVNEVREALGKDPLDLVGRVSFTQLEVPGRFDNMVFREVDVSDVGGNLEARFGEDVVRDMGFSYNPGAGTGMGGGGFSSIGLAEGGIVKKQPGGIIANIGEGNYDEAVIPLKPGMNMGTTINITVNAGMGADGGQIGEQIVNHIRRYERSSGPVFVKA